MKSFEERLRENDARRAIVAAGDRRWIRRAKRIAAAAAAIATVCCGAGLLGTILGPGFWVPAKATLALILIVIPTVATLVWTIGKAIGE